MQDAHSDIHGKVLQWVQCELADQKHSHCDHRTLQPASSWSRGYVEHSLLFSSCSCFSALTVWFMAVLHRSCLHVGTNNVLVSACMTAESLSQCECECDDEESGCCCTTDIHARGSHSESQSLSSSLIDACEEAWIPLPAHGQCFYCSVGHLAAATRACALFTSVALLSSCYTFYAQFL